MLRSQQKYTYLSLRVYMSQTFPETKNSYVCALRNERVFSNVQDIVHRKAVYMSDLYTNWSSEKMTLPFSKSITMRQNLLIAYSGVTS